MEVLAIQSGEGGQFGVVLVVGSQGFGGGLPKTE
jgi:hypothetical protein